MIETRRRDGEEENPRGRYALLRQALNILFMVGVVAGVLMYLYKSKDTGTVVILASMVLKFAECVLRLIK